MDLALNNLQRLICHKTKQTKPFLTFLLLSRSYNEKKSNRLFLEMNMFCLLTEQKSILIISRQSSKLKLELCKVNPKPSPFLRQNLFLSLCDQNRALPQQIHVHDKSIKVNRHCNFTYLTCAMITNHCDCVKRNPISYAAIITPCINFSFE